MTRKGDRLLPPTMLLLPTFNISKDVSDNSSQVYVVELKDRTRFEAT